MKINWNVGTFHLFGKEATYKYVKTRSFVQILYKYRVYKKIYNNLSCTGCAGRTPKKKPNPE